VLSVARSIDTYTSRPHYFFPLTSMKKVFVLGSALALLTLTACQGNVTGTTGTESSSSSVAAVEQSSSSVSADTGADLGVPADGSSASVDAGASASVSL
jgi:hypothetical protein